MSDRNPKVEAWIGRARKLPIEAGLLGRTVVWKNGGRGPERCGPCPACGGVDRFSINTAKGVWNCRGARGGNDAIGIAMHVAGVEFLEAVELLAGERPINWENRANYKGGQGRKESFLPDDVSRIARARARWARREPLTGSIAERYLRQARGLRGPFPATLAFLPARGEYGPAMIGAFGRALEPEPGRLAVAPHAVMATHLTRLLPDGSGKTSGADNKITPGCPKGSPIVLAPPNDGLGLIVTEGIEDALSAHEATGLGAWAAGSASLMPSLAAAVPAWIECVTILGHPDPNGKTNARALCARLTARGIRCAVTFFDGTEALAA